jgi:hypothetical protein
MAWKGWMGMGSDDGFTYRRGGAFLVCNAILLSLLSWLGRWHVYRDLRGYYMLGCLRYSLLFSILPWPSLYIPLSEDRPCLKVVDLMSE